MHVRLNKDINSFPIFSKSSIRVQSKYDQHFFFLNGRFHYLVCFDLALKRIYYLSVVILIYKADSCYIELIKNKPVTLFLLRCLVIHRVK